MAYTISGTVFNDANGNGVQDVGELGIEHVSVAVYDSTAQTLLGTATTDGSGSWSVDLTAQGAGTYKVHGSPLSGWVSTSSAWVTVTLTALVTTATVNFGQAHQGTVRQCFYPVSSWVHRVCWLPEKGVQVTFHNRRRVPYFTCYYPGTTYAMFQVFQVVPSKGRHVWGVYYYRPYVRQALLA
jgi:hypothetical protein